MRKITRKGLIRNLDAIVSKIVVKRDSWCVVCGTPNDPTCGHLFSRANYSTRWDLTNCHRQCLKCNLRHEYDPYPFNNWFILHFGKKAWDDLHAKHIQIKKWKDFELAELYEELKKMALDIGVEVK